MLGRFDLRSCLVGHGQPVKAPLLTKSSRLPVMFAVKGWSVSTEKLKPEVASAAPNAPGPKKSKKRKRQAGADQVTSSNVADLWEQVMERENAQTQAGKPQQSQPGEKKAKKDKKKRQKLDSDPVLPLEEKIEAHGNDKASKPDDKAARKDDKKEKAKKDRQMPKDAAAAATAAPAPSEQALVPSVPPAPPKLTPLQASMREKLISARFRHLNETLYTRPSAEALSLFAGSPEMFTEYHEGFRRQVEVWPENPVEGYLTDIRTRARARHPPRDSSRRAAPGENGAAPPQPQAHLQPLPRNRTTNVCTIADLGCGDARLAAELQRDKGKLRLEVLSFDLHSPSPLVTKADIANLPLANGSVDVAVFCLALMGTNWVDFIEEAYRVLRWKGELWVAEIKSRFGSGAAGPGGKKGGGGGRVVEHSVGHRRKPAAGKKMAGGKGAGEDGAVDEKTLLVEVDGVEDNRQQTDVSAFVDVLNKRGFMLVGQDQGQGAAAIDLSNKMFVKMRFIKAAPAVKGKCVRKELPTMAKRPKFIDAEETVDEAAVLKPCVYKIR
ncbi:hypothetical protein M406DRAFT_338403 [Cryphonectria parasitica EP155]|uniref:Ribosomal RNA-processing protein 8 n=1 Tax=Cryphonectria parasitica (strain ATCC 38755 / EP155) TaxID=660469 RepID=A0A9P4Y719_CRYP1|nr:uncharacterized protein M406DRAFT_338403 [Cryphonectria parasitica EP155]KAF3767681.1 hypothetical protein M406DRAFT_338403 [Cryphonectria parasitica EP155]